MSEVDTQNPVVEPEQKGEVSILAEDTTPKPDGQVVEEEGQSQKPHPLGPEGDRFKQVWARAKQAEAEAKELKARLDQEREERIRLEERAKVQQETQTQKEYTWAELENFIAEGRITRDQAQEYKEKAIEARLEKKYESKRVQETSQGQILSQIEQYKQLIPDVMTPGSENRQKYEQEFTYLVRTLGYPDNYATQLAATRAAFGDIERVKRSQGVNKTITPKEPFMETHTPAQKKQDTKSFKDTLPAYKITHYEKMMKAGLVKDWKDVEDLEKWSPKVVGGR